MTSFGRTLVDLAAALSVNELARACHEAGAKHEVTPAQVEAVLARRPTSPGAGKLRAILRGDERVSLSKLERAFLAFLREDELPLPITNRPAGRRAEGGLPLAGLPPDRGARQLPLPQLAPVMGGGPSPRAGGIRAW